MRYYQKNNGEQYNKYDRLKVEKPVNQAPAAWQIYDANGLGRGTASTEATAIKWAKLFGGRYEKVS